MLVIVNLDPHQPQETTFEIPLWEWRLPDDGSLQAEDLMTGNRLVLARQAADGCGSISGKLPSPCSALPPQDERRSHEDAPP